MATAIEKELEQIRKENGGTLQPKNVVDFARNPKTALHNRFTWDDSKAAEEYRLWQARSIIKVCVKLIPRPDGESIESRVYVSLYGDRKEGGDGYRTLVSVLNDKEQRAQLLSQALSEYEALGRKYQDLTELAEIFSAISNVRKIKKTRHGVAAPGRAANGATRQGRRGTVRKAG